MNKYHARKVVIDGITFHSIIEGEYYKKYKQMEADGLIHNLRRQVSYELIPPVWEETETVKHLKRGDKIVKRRIQKQRAITYIADFVFEKDGIEYVIDVKGRKTKEYILKKKMMYALKGIEITEVYAPTRKHLSARDSLSLVCLPCLLYPDQT